MGLTRVYSLNGFVFGGFRTNPVKGVGLPSYLPYDFQFHAQGSFNTFSFDACAAQLNDPIGVYWNNPIPGWQKSAYWQNYTFSGWGGLAANYISYPGNAWITPAWLSWTIGGLQ